MLNFRFRYIKVENIWKLTVLSKIENSWWLRKLATKSTCLYIKSASFHDFLSPVVGRNARRHVDTVQRLSSGARL